MTISEDTKNHCASLFEHAMVCKDVRCAVSRCLEVKSLAKHSAGCTLPSKKVRQSIEMSMESWFC